MKMRFADIGWYFITTALYITFSRANLYSQSDSLRAISKRTQSTSAKTEIFNSGYIDILNNGQINASARFIRLYIGEPGKFFIPLSLYSGVSSNNFQSYGRNQSNDILSTNFINPLSGIANISMEGIIHFEKTGKPTKMGVIYQLGERILTGIRSGTFSDPFTGKPHNFLNSFCSIGLYLQTGAWERSNARNVGISWVAYRYIGCYSNPKQIMEFLPTIITNGFYHGYSIAWGVEIVELVNIKVVYYKYNKKPEIEYSLPIYQFSFNYTVR